MDENEHTPTPSSTCVDCGTSTFCGAPHGAGHDHSAAALACTSSALAGA